MTNPDDFDSGLTEVAAYFRQCGEGGRPAFVLRARDRIAELERENAELSHGGVYWAKSLADVVSEVERLRKLVNDVSAGRKRVVWGWDQRRNCKGYWALTEDRKLATEQSYDSPVEALVACKTLNPIDEEESSHGAR